MSKVTATDTVLVHYTGKLENGEIFDDSTGRDPLEVSLGQGMVIPGFENGLVDMEVNEKKTIHIPAAEAYGEHRPELIQDVPKDQLPAEIKPEVGMQLVSQTPDGQQIPLIVTQVEEQHITVDANAPLAGKDLTFDLELVAIK
ncbi:MAG: peptidylprolyl isomerase [Bacteroidetes bacterium]|nr:peptidylprolyl isomerase [Bacteroidota bacterium]